MKGSVTLLPILALAAQAASDCKCGYTVISTASPDYALFTEILETDFLHVNHTQSLDWIPQAYNVTPEAARAPYGKAAQIENFVSNIIASPYDWSGPGTLGHSPGLQLWSRARLIDSPGTNNDSMIPMAELVSKRTDILYGSFRIGMMNTKVQGTCAAFFFYRNDSQEIDMEFLSSQQQQKDKKGTVNLVIQSPTSAKLGYVDNTSPDFNEQVLSFAPGEGYNEYRFDWLPDRVDFYANGQLLSTTTESVPSEAGSIHLIHWSSGDPGWSGGPPGEDAVLTISYVKAYFNSSDPTTTENFGRDCQADGETCEVPGQTTAPNPLTGNENETGKTFFFTDQSSDQKAGPDGSESSTSDAVKGAAAWFVSLLAVWVSAGL